MKKRIMIVFPILFQLSEINAPLPSMEDPRLAFIQCYTGLPCVIDVYHPEFPLPVVAMDVW
jgi:hypothetical protein